MFRISSVTEFGDSTTVATSEGVEIEFLADSILLLHTTPIPSCSALFRSDRCTMLVELWVHLMKPTRVTRSLEAYYMHCNYQS